MTIVRIYLVLAVVCWCITIAVGSGLFKMKNDTRAVIVSWIFLCIGIGFYSLMLIR